MEGDMMVVYEGDYFKDLPPGFRFHPTDEEIITYYLKEKVINNEFTAQAIGEVDLNKCEPWDLPKKAKMGDKEYFFYYKRDRKYPTGMRANRATESGYWKATGKDKEILKGKGKLVGMKKTLVFYKGRAPKGEKTNWIMHEFRLEGTFSSHCMPNKSKEEWVVSKVYHKMAAKGHPIGELIRVDSLVNYLLNSPPMPGLIEMNSADNETHEYSNFTNDGKQIKDLNNSLIARATNESFSFNVSSSSGFNNQIAKMDQYQPTNINYYQASSSNSSPLNPIFYPGNTNKNIEFASQDQEIKPGNFPGYNPGPGSNHAFSQEAIMKECKMEQYSTNNSMLSYSQDTGLSADYGPPEISSMVSKPTEKAFEFLSSDPIIAESDPFWDY